MKNELVEKTIKFAETLKICHVVFGEYDGQIIQAEVESPSGAKFYIEYDKSNELNMIIMAAEPKNKKQAMQLLHEAELAQAIFEIKSAA